MTVPVLSGGRFAIRLRRNWWKLPILGFVPALLLLLLATFGPIVQALNLAFHKTKYLTTGAFGLSNFASVLNDEQTISGLGVTVIFAVVSTSIAVIVGLLIASLLRSTKHPGVFETIFLLPWIVSQLQSGLIWKFLYSPNVGLFAVVWKSLFPNAVGLLGDTRYALSSMILTNTWQILPFAIIIINAALMTVPADLVEAAQVDGASALQLHTRILFPQIRSSILVVVIMLSLHGFNMVQLPLIMTGGGPAGATDLIGLQVYRDAFVSFNFGRASALATLMLIVNIAFTAIYIRFLGKDSR